MAVYEYVTIWRVEAPLKQVWDRILHSELWPEWWKGAESVAEIRKGDENGIGNLRRYTWKGLVPYRLSFNIRVTHIEPLLMLEGVAYGDLIGLGRWQFKSDGNQTAVRYDWKVKPNKRWLCFLFPVASSLFKWNHNVVMRWGAQGLSEQLKVKVNHEDKQDI